MQMKLASDIDPQKGFVLEHGGYSKSQQKNNMKAKRYYVPPCTIRCVRHIKALPQQKSVCVSYPLYIPTKRRGVC